MKLVQQINSVPLEIKSLIESRLNEFRSFKNKSDEEWFSELCFCLLTANSRAKTALAIQKDLGFEGFSKHEKEEISKVIRKNKHRFHNNKAKFIVEARKHMPIKSKIQT